MFPKLRYPSNSWLFVSFPGPQRKFRSSGSNLSGWTSQLSLLCHPKGVCVFPSKIHGFSALRNLDHCPEYTLLTVLLVLFSVYGHLGSITKKSLGWNMWSKNTWSFISWPHCWGHSEDQTVCFPSPVFYPFCQLKLWKFWHARNLRGQKVTEGWIYLKVGVDWILLTLHLIVLSQRQIKRASGSREQVVRTGWKCQLRQESSKQLCFPIVVVLLGDDDTWRWKCAAWTPVVIWVSISANTEGYVWVSPASKEREKEKEAPFRKEEPVNQRSTSSAVYFMSFIFDFLPLVNLQVSI